MLYLASSPSPQHGNANGLKRGVSLSDSIVTVFHIDSDASAAHLLQREMKSWSEIRHVGMANSYQSGMEGCTRRAPKVVLMELALGDADGLFAAADIKKLRHSPKILGFSSRLDEFLLYELGNGNTPLAGYVWKPEATLEELRFALSMVANDREHLSRAVLNRLGRLLRSPHWFPKILSDRQIRLITLLGRGLTDAEIAVLLKKTPAGIHSARARIMKRLGLSRTDQIMVWAAKKGFVYNLSRSMDMNAADNALEKCEENACWINDIT